MTCLFTHALPTTTSSIFLLFLELPNWTLLIYVSKNRSRESNYGKGGEKNMKGGEKSIWELAGGSLYVPADNG